ncbi:hypothetical protein EV421DRAFT_1908341 [Armillaria borealis]|uniref:F-box domain-containing protein n=1 Tax=Armillaria borealis TaxID=47425 RepID=A0AA39MJL8_9AGAR|nr:hypothetical protein EV421DRAFT_1908341 [Armillaria borealis]
MDHAELLVLRGLSLLLATVATRWSHRHLRLRLPEEWMMGQFREHAGISIAVEEEYLTTSEVALFCFIVRWGLMDVVHSFRFDNWPELRVCFFFHLLPTLQEVRVTSIDSLFHSYTKINFPYMLLSSVLSVLLRGCIFDSHSLELMLHPCQILDHLSLQSVYGGHIVRVVDAIDVFSCFTGRCVLTCPLLLQVLPDVALDEVEEWERRHFVGLRYVPCSLNPIPAPSLRRLGIDLNSGGLCDAVDCLPHHHRSSHLLDQLLSMPDWVDDVQAVIGVFHVFPVALRSSVLEHLDLVVGGSLGSFHRSMWTHLGDSVRQLSVCYVLDGSDHEDTGLYMGALVKLEVLELTCMLEMLHHALNTLQTYLFKVIRAVN